jgi:hypothetical protein
MKKLLTLLCLLCSFAVVEAQETSSGDPDDKPVRKEKVEGLFPVMGYLGGKLIDELSGRLNLDDGEKKTVKTEVEVELGPFKFKRVEDRPAK